MKKYKIIILNNSNRSNYTLLINKLSAYIYFSIIILIISFSIFGFFRFLNPHVKQNDYNLMKSFKKETNNIFEIVNLDSIIANNQQIKSYLDLVPNQKPVDGIVTKGLSDHNSNHNGIDIATRNNSPVLSAQQGMVVFSDLLNDYGNTVIISHPNSYYTVYSHLEKSIVNQRDYLSANQIIGYVGQTGNSDGPHLHFEIWKNNHILDPRDFIEEYKLKDVSVE